jgi:hypothetical protein
MELVKLEDEKSELIKKFFAIGSNANLEELEEHKIKLQLYLETVDDAQIKELLSVINAILIYSKENDKEKAREFVIDVSARLLCKHDFDMYDMRILNCILFSMPRIEEVINFSTDALIQLENYTDHEHYNLVKINLNFNLALRLMQFKYFDKTYTDDLDVILHEALDIVIALGMEHNMLIHFCSATIRKDVLVKDKVIIYSALKLLESTGVKENDEFIKAFISSYNIAI